MAKIIHNNSVNSINSIYSHAKDEGIMHLSNVNSSYNQQVFDTELFKELLNFGSLSYLGLDRHLVVLESAKKFIELYGSQSVMSRTYVESQFTTELEAKLTSFFEKKVITYPRTTLAHLSIFPSIMERGDLIVFDQQAHFSMQLAGKLVLSKGVDLEMIKHNNIQALELILKNKSSKYNRIWYVADGVYSMFGDFAPLRELEVLLSKYNNFFLYIDDAHGISWTGKKGIGYVWSNLKKKSKVLYISTMAKGFGAHGGIAILPNDCLYERVKMFGGALSFSLPMSPADTGAAIGALEVHLSGEIEKFQEKLKNNIEYFNSKILHSKLPFILVNESPIFFLGLSKKEYVIIFLKKLNQSKVYANPAIFPAVPETRSGVRIGVTANHDHKNIDYLFYACEKAYKELLSEQGISTEIILKFFKEIRLEKSLVFENKQLNSEYMVQLESSVLNLDELEWESCFPSNGMMNKSALLTLESSFKENENEYNNWKFYYLIVRREENSEIVFAGLFSLFWMKNDFVSGEGISLEMEQKRIHDPKFFISKTLGMGTMVTEGKHCCFLNSNKLEKENVWKEVFKTMETIQIQEGATNVLLRDFDEGNEFNEYFLNKGFTEFRMPNSNIADLKIWENEDFFLNSLSKRGRQHFKKYVYSFLNDIDISIKKTATNEELEHFYQLYLNVKRNNLGINTFEYPKKLFFEISKSNSWEFLIFKMKQKNDENSIGVVCSHISERIYSPVIIGMDYEAGKKVEIYRQALYQIILRAKELELSTINFGFSADLEKKRMGAIQYARVGYMQSVDNYQFDMLNLLE